MEPTDPSLAATLAAVAQTLAAEGDLTSVINRVCRLAVDTIDGCDHADIMIITAGGVITAPAASDWIGTRAVSIEAEFQQGPCVDAARTRQIVHTSDLATDTRWPEFAARCLTDTPVRSSVGFPLLLAGRAIGALDIYADRVGAFQEEHIAIGALFAAHAAVAFAAAREQEHLRDALANRDVIGQAKGILISQSHITADEAFDLLRQASQRLNEKVIVIAQRIVDKSSKSQP